MLYCNMSRYWIPILLWILFDSIISVCILGSLRWRRWMIPMICYLSWQLLKSVRYMPRPLSEFWSLCVYYSIMYAVQHLYLSGLQLPIDENSTFDRLRHAHRITNNPRRLRFDSGYDTQHVITLANRVRLLPYSWSLCFGLIVLNHYAVSMLTDHNLLHDKRWLRASSERLLYYFTVRACTTASAIYLPKALLNTVHTLLGSVFVYILRVDEAHEWPPLFGNLSDIRSIETFWSR